MTEQTPGTSADPELVAEGDDDQLPLEDTLLDRGVDDLLDEGYSPPERERTDRWGETAWEEAHGEPLTRRLAEEEPEVWQRDPAVDPSRQTDRAGRLVADDAAVAAGGNDQFADDLGVAGGAASAEEAAVHVLDDDELDGRFDAHA